MLSARRRFALFVCLGALLFGVVAHRQILTMTFRWLDVGSDPEKTEAVFVFFGNNDTRPYVAAALYNAGYVKEILMATDSTNQFVTQHRPSEEVYRNVMLSRGVPPQRIRSLGDHGVKNTMTESATLSEYLTQYPSVVVTVVTSHYHTRRTRWALRRHLGQHADRLRFVSAPEDDFGPGDWWLNVTGFELVCLELIKLVGYWLFYGSSSRYLAAVVLFAVGSWYLHRRKTGYSLGGNPQSSPERLR